MTKNKTIHRAFRIVYHNAIVNTLVTPAWIKPPFSLVGKDEKKLIKVGAIWDTGATHTVITKRIVDELNLKPISKIKVFGVNSQRMADVYMVDIGLPNRVIFPDMTVTECDINSPKIDILIGMDVIQRGDFAIANAKGETLFSYCTPPHKYPIDLLEKSERVNLKRKK